MIIEMYDETSICASEHSGDEVGVRRLWSAVLLQALEDWQSNSLGRQSEADRFLFHSQADFANACNNAGLDPLSVTNKLNRMKRTGAHKQAFPFLRAA